MVLNLQLLVIFFFIIQKIHIKNKMRYKFFFCIRKKRTKMKWMTLAFFVYFTDKLLFFYCRIVIKMNKKNEEKKNWKAVKWKDNIAWHLVDWHFFRCPSVYWCIQVNHHLIRIDYFSSSFAGFCDDVDVDPVPLVALMKPVLRANFLSNLDFYSCHCGEVKEKAIKIDFSWINEM